MNHQYEHFYSHISNLINSKVDIIILLLNNNTKY
jgi:hypothetical protein